MQVKILTKKEAVEIANDLSLFQLYRPSHRVMNFYDRKSNITYITEFQDFMSGHRELSLAHSRNLAVETEPDDLLQFLPEDVRKNKDIKAFEANTAIFFVVTEGRYFVLGNKYYNNRMLESRVDGVKLLGEVAAGEEFSPVWLPRIGFAIRIIPRHELQRGYPYSPDQEYEVVGNSMMPKDNSGIFILVNANGDFVFESSGEDRKKLHDFLNFPEIKDSNFARQLRYWKYPTPLGEDHETTFYNTRFVYSQKDGEIIRRSNNKKNEELKFKCGSGVVAVSSFNGEVTMYNCVPWTEYAFSETFL